MNAMLKKAMKAVFSVLVVSLLIIAHFKMLNYSIQITRKDPLEATGILQINKTAANILDGKDTKAKTKKGYIEEEDTDEEEEEKEEKKKKKKYDIDDDDEEDDDDKEYRKEAKKKKKSLKKKEKDEEEEEEEQKEKDDDEEEVEDDDDDDDDRVKITRSEKKEGPHKKRFPDVIIIGVKKSGTGALKFMLSKHPAIVAPSGEPHFFDQYYSKGLNYYRNQMEKSYRNQLTLEKTPRYFISPKVPRRVYKFDKKVKIIFIVRDPIERFTSDYVHCRNLESIPDVGINTIVMENKHKKNLDKVLRPSFYGYHYLRWLQYFKKNQIHIVDGERLIKNPYEELVPIESFLNIFHFFRPNYFTRNRTTGFFCFQKSSFRDCLPKSKGHHHPYLYKKSKAKLFDILKEDIRRFLNTTERRFKWSQDYV